MSKYFYSNMYPNYDPLSHYEGGKTERWEKDDENDEIIVTGRYNELSSVCNEPLIIQPKIKTE